MTRSNERLAELGLALGLACGQAVSIPEPVADTAGALPSCEPQACSALAGPCQVGACDARTNACRLSAAGEGEPCLEGNVCGPAVCRNGECSALEPHLCSMAESEQCRAAICRPERGGCISEPLAPPGATCEKALPLEAIGLSSVSASSQCGDHARQFPGCTSGLLGPSAHFVLDLRAATVPTPVALAIDADFSFEAVLTRGPCGDSILEACATPLQTDSRSRALSVTVSPGYYELVVTGSSESDQGPVHVAASVGPATCAAATMKDECAGGLAFDPTLATQTVISHGACGNLGMPIRCGLQPVGDVFYDLDLSSRTAPTLLEVDAAGLTRRPDVFAALFSATESGCGEFAMCGSRFTSRLLPGRYRIGVSRAFDDDTDTELPVAVRVRLREADCAATTNDTWQTATELDPNAERQRLGGNTACGSDDFSGACNSDRGAPELFYRLDLRNRRAPSDWYFSGASDSDLVAYMLVPDAMGVPSGVAGCQVLSPRSGTGEAPPRSRFRRSSTTSSSMVAARTLDALISNCVKGGLIQRRGTVLTAMYRAASTTVSRAALIHGPARNVWAPRSNVGSLPQFMRPFARASPAAVTERPIPPSVAPP